MKTIPNTYILTAERLEIGAIITNNEGYVMEVIKLERLKDKVKVDLESAAGTLKNVSFKNSKKLRFYSLPERGGEQCQ